MMYRLDSVTIGSMVLREEGKSELKVLTVKDHA